MQCYIYVVGCTHTDKAGKRKLGLTLYPVHRMRQYDTGDCPGEGLEKRYQALFLTNAKTKKELHAIEKILHTHFSERRLPRENNRSSEWFQVDLHEVVTFLEKSPLILRQVSVEEICDIHEQAKKALTKEEQTQEKEELELMDEQKHIEETERYDGLARTSEERISSLNLFQAPHEERLRNMFLLKTPLAAMMQAVCGYGKTVVTCKSLRGTIDRVFICVPTGHLRSSWKKALLDYSGFSSNEIEILSEDISSEGLKVTLAKPRYALLLCYASSHILHEVLDERAELGIFDEAHKLAGIAEQVDDDETQIATEKKRDIGRTKRLIRKCKALDIQRLSLTFTPKGFHQEETNQDIINSNDDVDLFGETILKVSLREMIEKKLLPPYKILFPQVSHTFTGIKARVQLVLHEFMRKDHNKFKINKLILFGADYKSCDEIIQHLKDLLPANHGVNLVYVNSASRVKSCIETFTTASRSIMINCLLLGDGVDVPVADSVAILCSRKSYTQIVQMLLRPGRYFPGKEHFYIIMALNDEDDNEFISFILDAVAQIDPHLDMQLILRALRKGSGGSGASDTDNDSTAEMLEDIICSEDALWHEIPKIQQILYKIIQRRSKPTTRLYFERIRGMCHTAGIRNTSGFNAVREQYNWPEAPWLLRDMTAYDFFHGTAIGEMSQESFKKILLENSISYEIYDIWQRSHSELPSVEDINDGYFGRLVTNLQDLFPQTRRRR